MQMILQYLSRKKKIKRKAVRWNWEVGLRWQFFLPSYFSSKPQNSTGWSCPAISTSLNFTPTYLPCLSALLLLLLGGFLLAGRRLGSLGWLGLGGGGDLRWRQGLLGLLLVGGQSGGAAGDVDVLTVIGDVLQGKLRAVAGAQTHGAWSQSVGRLADLCRERVFC